MITIKYNFHSLKKFETPKDEQIFFRGLSFKHYLGREMKKDN